MFRPFTESGTIHGPFTESGPFTDHSPLKSFTQPMCKLFKLFRSDWSNIILEVTGRTSHFGTLRHTKGPKWRHF